MHIAAGKFKASCLKLMDQVRETREEVIITKRGTPVAKLVPADTQVPELFGLLQSSAVVHGDIVEPIGQAWDADA